MGSVIKIQLRRDTAENWALNDPVLAEGEPALELDTGVIKYGDGETNYNDLPSFFGANFYNSDGVYSLNENRTIDQKGGSTTFKNGTLSVIKSPTVNSSSHFGTNIYLDLNNISQDGTGAFTSCTYNARSNSDYNIKVLRGVGGEASFYGNGNIEELQGANIYTTFSGNGTVDNGTGANIVYRQAGGTADLVKGLYVEANLSFFPTINRVYGLYINNNYTSGTANEGYGIYLKNGNDIFTNNHWAFYSDFDVKSYFGGNVNIGTQTNENARVHIKGKTDTILRLTDSVQASYVEEKVSSFNGHETYFSNPFAVFFGTTAHILDCGVSTVSGAKLLGVRNGGIEKGAIDKDGVFTSEATILQIDTIGNKALITKEYLDDKINQILNP